MSSKRGFRQPIYKMSRISVGKTAKLYKPSCYMKVATDGPHDKGFALDKVKILMPIVKRPLMKCTTQRFRGATRSDYCLNTFMFLSYHVLLYSEN